MRRAWAFVRRHWLALGSPLWALGVYVGIAAGFGVGVGLRGAWQDRRRVFRPYDEFGSRR